jgi:hypothetical protein
MLNCAFFAGVIGVLNFASALSIAPRDFSGSLGGDVSEDFGDDC